MTEPAPKGPFGMDHRLVSPGGCVKLEPRSEQPVVPLVYSAMGPRRQRDSPSVGRRCLAVPGMTRFLSLSTRHGRFARRGAANGSRSDALKHPPPILYLGCEGCGQVTAHTSHREMHLPIESGSTAFRSGTPVLRESVCDVCGHAQPRVIGDQVESDTEVRGRTRVGWLWFDWRSCRQTFRAPAAAPWPVCPWCLMVQHPLLTG